MRPLIVADTLGWLHQGTARRGVVLVPAQGYEAICAYRATFDLAEAIAAHGLPVLRFDSPGTGDGLGDDDDPARLAAWQAGVAAAIDALKAATGVDEVALVGLRLGATLALRAACQRPDVQALVLLAPVLNGKTYLREMKARAMLFAQGTGPAPADVPSLPPGTESAGCFLSVETTDDLREIIGPPLFGTRKPRLLLIEPQPSREGTELSAQFGTEAETRSFVGYEDLLTNPTLARSPPIWPDIAQWLASGVEPGHTIEAPPIARSPDALAGEGFRETPALFGPRQGLAGVLCVPEPSPPSGRIVLILNGGRNPRMGWARSSTRLARRLARAGIASFRFDCAGLGDSARDPAQPGEVLYSEARIVDVRAALDHLEALGYHDFILSGLCSGAHLAFHSAVADPRIRAIAMINLQKFIWKDGDSLDIAILNTYRSTAFYRARMFSPETWQRALRGEIDVWGIGKALIGRKWAALRDRLGEFTAQITGRETDKMRILRAFARLDQRGLRGLLYYSAADTGLDELAIYLGSGYPRLATLPGFELEIIDGPDHNLTPYWARRAFEDRLIAFLATLPAGIKTNGTTPS